MNLGKQLKEKALPKVSAALRRADEIGGEVRDYLTEQVFTPERYQAAKDKVNGLVEKARAFTGRGAKATETPAPAAAAEATSTPAPTGPSAAAAKSSIRPLGDVNLVAQIYGRHSCPWTGRALTIFEKGKIDYDFYDLEDPTHEPLIPRLISETHQQTIPYVFLRGRFIGGYNALSEVVRLGQMEAMLLSPEERAKRVAAGTMVEIAERGPNEFVPSEEGTPAVES
jgi:glutaredoxin